MDEAAKRELNRLMGPVTPEDYEEIARRKRQEAKDMVGKVTWMGEPPWTGLEQEARAYELAAEALRARKKAAR